MVEFLWVGKRNHADLLAVISDRQWLQVLAGTHMKRNDLTLMWNGSQIHSKYLLLTDADTSVVVHFLERHMQLVIPLMNNHLTLV
jgi:hypothetical protein